MLSWYQDGPTSTTWYSSLTRGSCYRRHMARQTSTVIIERKTRLDGSVSEYRCERLSLDVDRYAGVRYVIDRDYVIAYTDLVVDVLLRPSGETIVLDEEGLPPDLAPARRIHIARALEAIAAG